MKRISDYLKKNNKEEKPLSISRQNSLNEKMTNMLNIGQKKDIKNRKIEKENKNMKNNYKEFTGKNLLKVKLPLELAHCVLCKYNKNFGKLLLGRFLMVYKKTNLKSINRRYRETHLILKSSTSFTQKMIGFVNLKVLDVMDINYFNFEFIEDLNLQKLKIKNVKNISIRKNISRYKIKNVKIEEMYINLIELEKIIQINSLIGITIKNVYINGSNNINESLLQSIILKTQLKKLKIIQMKISEEFIYKIVNNLHLNVFKFEECNFKFSYCNKITKIPNIFMENCKDILYTLNYSDIKSFKLFDSHIKLIKLEMLNFSDLKEISFNEAKIDQECFDFICKKYTSLEQISFSKCDFPIIKLYDIVRKYTKTLKFLDIRNIEIPIDFLEFVKNNLKNSTVIYSDNKKLEIL
ncbi:hypothetical protein CWI39_0217p0010 [Hamiltosporidium magnivora]|uniref:Leucine-rich repeat-containing protein n=1 Tax=Hamiltosporidium magnivora TaxID=148818 RepID=A0A4Q9LIZ9_9MICR|nr:hypothetical protein CWI39_0217p0010 [Hamiltosporidium magnivora]